MNPKVYKTLERACEVLHDNYNNPKHEGKELTVPLEEAL